MTTPAAKPQPNHRAGFVAIVGARTPASRLFLTGSSARNRHRHLEHRRPLAIASRASSHTQMAKSFSSIRPAFTKQKTALNKQMLREINAAVEGLTFFS